MRCLMLAVLSVGALACSDDPPVKPDTAPRAQTTSATSTQRSSSSYRFVKRPIVVYTAVPPSQPDSSDSFDYQVAFRLNRAIPVGKRGIRGQMLLEEQPNLVKLFRVSRRTSCYIADFRSSEGSAAALIRPVEGQLLRIVLRVKGQTADRDEVTATRGSYSLVFNERRQRERYRQLGCSRYLSGGDVRRTDFGVSTAARPDHTPPRAGHARALGTPDVTRHAGWQGGRVIAGRSPSRPWVPASTLTSGRVCPLAGARLADRDGSSAVYWREGTCPCVGARRTAVAHRENGDVANGHGDRLDAVADLLGEADAELRIVGAEDGDQAGQSVASVGDINDDGLDDVLVGAPGADPAGRQDAGAAYLILGAEGGDPATVSLRDESARVIRLVGARPGDRAGSSVASGGDLNGDGFLDLLVGAPGSGPAAARQGWVYAVFGGPTLSTVELGNLGAGGLTIRGPALTAATDVQAGTPQTTPFGGQVASRELGDFEVAPRPLTDQASRPPWWATSTATTGPTSPSPRLAPAPPAANRPGRPTSSLASPATHRLTSRRLARAATPSAADPATA